MKIAIAIILFFIVVVLHNIDMNFKKFVKAYLYVHSHTGITLE